MQPESVVLRYVLGGRVWGAMPLLLVDDHERFALWLPPGAVMHGPRSPGRERAVPAGEWSTYPRAWTGRGALILARPDAAHAIWLFWRDDGEFGAWYVNLQEPLRQTRFGFDTMDQALDLIARPDRTWEWKDEDELAEQVELGVWTPEEAAAIRAEGESVVEAWPFPTGWEEFEAEPSWPVPELPEDWHVV